MKVYLSIVGKVFLKLGAIVAYPILSLACIVIQIAVALYRFVSVPVAVVFGLLAGMDFYQHGLTQEVIISAALALGVIALRFTLPYVPIGIELLKGILEDTMRSPLTTNSPVKYTI